MKKLTVLPCMLGLLLFSPLVVAKEYCNVRFDYCVDVPNRLHWAPEAINGDGRHFDVPNLDVDILIYGTHSPYVQDFTDREYIENHQRRYHAATEVTYEHKQGNTYTVSGYGQYGQIYYHVIKVKDGVAVHMNLNYAEDVKEEMDAIVQQMAGSFRLN